MPWNWERMYKRHKYQELEGWKTGVVFLVQYQQDPYSYKCVSCFQSCFDSSIYCLWLTNITSAQWAHPAHIIHSSVRSYFIKIHFNTVYHSWSMQQCQKRRQSASHTVENVLSQHYRWEHKGMSPKVHKTMTCTKGGTGIQTYPCTSVSHLSTQSLWYSCLQGRLLMGSPSSYSTRQI